MHLPGRMRPPCPSYPCPYFAHEPTLCRFLERKVGFSSSEQQPVRGFTDKVLVGSFCDCVAVPGQITSPGGKFESRAAVQLVSKSAAGFKFTIRVDNMIHASASELVSCILITIKRNCGFVNL